MSKLGNELLVDVIMTYLSVIELVNVDEEELPVAFVAFWVMNLNDWMDLIKVIIEFKGEIDSFN